MQNWDQSIHCPAGQDVDSSANESEEATPCMASGGSSFLVHGGQLLAKSLIAQLLPPTARHGGGVPTVDTVKPRRDNFEKATHNFGSNRCIAKQILDEQSIAHPALPST